MHGQRSAGGRGQAVKWVGGCKAVKWVEGCKYKKDVLLRQDYEKTVDRVTESWRWVRRVLVQPARTCVLYTVCHIFLRWSGIQTAK